jgi:hypothetical protein
MDAGRGVFAYTLRYYIQTATNHGNAGAYRICLGEVKSRYGLRDVGPAMEADRKQESLRVGVRGETYA